MALKVKLSSRSTFVIQMLSSKAILVMRISFILGSLEEERHLLSIFSSQPLFSGREVPPEGKLLWKSFMYWKESDDVDSVL